MKITLIRNATLWLEYAGVKFLIDPMLSEPGVNPPIPNTENDRRNPLVPLPPQWETLGQPDAVIVTHLHPDHWDPAAAQWLDKQLPVLCQPGNEDQIAANGFTQVTPIWVVGSVGEIEIIRTTGHHGTGEIGEQMGPVSGFVFQAPGEPVVYLAGDTIWCSEVSEALDKYHPEWTIVNAGGARFTVGDPITMTAQDVTTVAQHAPYTQVVAVHMEAINHCLLTRTELTEHIRNEGLSERVHIPVDGESLSDK
ncbi:MBL fold metallo-hydrolase [Paenibacillus maysiensis]|uniref:MBL fold metallo-hydrolase n=1 Tax=Paenibacillus maysiensis TaxID=1155954 RepID=UPI0004709D91|nr:MBL fold metallo-hydrolase [Paenibacillus maysiensis]